MNPFIDKILGNEPEPTKISSKNEFVVGKIYATWCGHCVALEPKWKKLTQQLRKNVPKKRNLVIAEIESENMDAGLAALNATHLPNSDKKVELNGGYPTIFKIMDGKVTYYEGPREVKPMLKWVLAGIKTKSMTQKRHKNHKRGRNTRDKRP
jgi:thiol-disulfide isomerase/thioredoxin